MVDSVVTKRELIDAQKDAQTLGEIVNGEPGKLVKTRLDREVYTLASVPQINTMTREEISTALNTKGDKAETISALNTKANQADTFLKNEVTSLIAPKAEKTYVDSALTGFTNGASKFYPTLAAANADIANIMPKLVTDTITDKVEISEVVNGGTWYKEIYNATSLTKSPYDSLTQSKEFTKSFVDLAVKGVDKKITNKPTENILNVVDGEGKLSMLVDSGGYLYLTGLEGSVQSNLGEINDIKQNINLEEKKKNIAELIDGDDNVYAIFNANAELLLTGLKQSVQSTLNSDNFNSQSNSYIHSSKGVITSDVQPYLLSCLSGGGIIAPMPFSQAPHNFTPPTDLLNVKVTQGQRLIVDTVYQKDDGVVHPHILEFRNGFLGYRYILGLTPYYLTQDKYENPCIYGSHDLESFELIDKFPQPFSEHPLAEFEGQYAYNSDDFFSYDFYSGELLFCWRRSYDTVEPRNEIWGSRTKNGLDWTHEELIYDGKTLGGVLLSPSIIFNFSTGLFELFVVEFTQSGWRIRKLTSPTLKNPKWVHAKYFQAIPNAEIWHLDVRYVGNKVYAMAHDDAMTGEGSTKNLYLGVYDEATNEFVWSDAVLVGEHYDPYKATFTPIFDHENNSIALQILWSSRSGGDENMWRLYSSKSNSISL